MEYDLKVDSFSRGPESPPQREYPAPVYQSPLLVVTSFSPAGYDDYGKRFLETFVRYWPQEIILACFYEGERPDIEDARIWYFDLLKDRDLQDWLMRYGNDPKARGIRNGVRDFRFDAVRFAPKVFALTSPLLPMTGWRIWIDADVETTRTVPESFFSKLLRTTAVAAYLGRPKEVFATSECGFVAYHTAIPAGRQFLIDLRANYSLGKIFGFPEWHDSAVFDILRRAYEEAGSTFKNLAEPYYSSLKGPLTFEEHGHPWPNTPLGEYFTHYKGPKGKERAIAHQPDETEAIDLQRLCNDPAITSRYQQITRILSVLPHESIVEVGVAKGERAVAMCSINLERGKKVKYTGFDLFEDITPEISALEHNGKGVDAQDKVAEKLDALKIRFPGLFEWELVKGNTRETLPKHPVEDVDVAFIDGGHSVETIESDFRSLEKKCGLILLDDYYEGGVDTEKFGCNRLFESLKSQKTLLPRVDVFGEQKVRIAAYGAILKRHGEPLPLRIKTKNCVADTEIQANIRNAFTYSHLTTWLPGVCRPVNDPVVFVGGANSVCKENDPDYAHNWHWIKTYANTGYRVVVCKTSYKAALSEGVLPWACLLLDPRDHVAQWVDPLDERINYFIASMCHPTTWEHVCKPGMKIYGYHAGVGAQEAPLIAELWGDASIVHGGTTSSFRGLSLLYNMGFRKFKTIGLDSSYSEKPEKPHGRSEKPVQNVTIGREYNMARNFWTDPELVAQSQDAEMIAKLHPTLDIEYLGDGLLQHAQRVLDRMVESAGPLAIAPREQLFAVWQQAIKGRQILPEALFIDDLISVLEERRNALHGELFRQPSFDELINRESERKAA